MTITPTNPRQQLHGALPAADRNRLIEAQRLQRLGQMPEAEALYRLVLQRHPASFDAISSLGVFACALGRYEDGVTLLRMAITVDAKQADAYINLGRALHLQGKADEALACVDMALQLDTADDSMRLEAASWLAGSGQLQEAKRLLEPMLKPGADAAESSFRAGQALLALGDPTGALNSFAASAAAGRRQPDVFIRQGELLSRAGRHTEAAAAYAQALELDAVAGPALMGGCAAWLALGRPGEAIALADRAVVCEPDSVNARHLQGTALRALNRLEEACQSFRSALQLDPNHRASVSDFAFALLAMHRYEDAALAFERLLVIWPDCAYAKGMLLHSKMLICDWLHYDRLLDAIEHEIDSGLGVADFGMQAYCDSPARLQRAAQSFTRMYHPDRSAEWSPAPLVAHEKIRIGYVSGEFRLHATSILLTRLLELHDRTAFEIFAFDNGSADDSSYRHRIDAAVTEIVPIAALSDEAALRVIRERQIDILIDLNGHCGKARQTLFSLRPAPVQVSFLGFPGTLGAPYMDYVIADSFVIPQADRGFYDEAVVTLPDSYQPNDTQWPVAANAASRRDQGLPEDAFVFCCFNNAYKITPDVFAVWMRVLARTPGSVLWLFELVPESSANLIECARSHNIAAQRLVFAKTVPLEQHLARLRLADLVLDTLPYNAHTTGSDALRVGVPMLTCLGTSFSGRVGASLLSAAGLPELITRSLPEYEAMAVHLAKTPEALASLRERLIHNWGIAPLFDADRYRLHIEAAFREMVRRAQLGLAPAHIDVPACSPSLTTTWQASLPFAIAADRSQADSPPGVLTQPLAERQSAQQL
ncbi:MAG: tetratricopeptide repeat protein [Cytophagales bacterium]|nr:tetratricopeptide repeat protein [Rhizobacter sp.]